MKPDLESLLADGTDGDKPSLIWMQKNFLSILIAGDKVKEGSVVTSHGASSWNKPDAKKLMSDRYPSMKLVD
jgi:hypothetical protein